MISSLLKEFIFDLQIKNYSERTIETYNYNCSQLIYYLRDHFEIEDIDDVASLHIKKFIQYQTSIGSKPTYINTLIKSIRAFYVYLVAEEYVTLNVMKK